MKPLRAQKWLVTVMNIARYKFIFVLLSVLDIIK